jgi:hypothetical protein
MVGLYAVIAIIVVLVAGPETFGDEHSPNWRVIGKRPDPNMTC